MTVSIDLPVSPTLSIAGLGDSLTYGWMVRRGYFDRFVDALAKRSPGVEISRLNAGVPGDTARGGLERVSSVLSAAPSLMVVQFGINDLFAGVSPGRFEASYRAILDTVLEAGVTPVPVTSCPLAEPRMQSLIDERYEIIRNLARELALPIGDMDAFWRRSFPVEDHLQDDGVHPTDKGHAIMAEALLEIL